MMAVNIVRRRVTLYSRLTVEIPPCLLEMVLNKSPVIGVFLRGIDA
jgi:hypothetical protein